MKTFWRLQSKSNKLAGIYFSATVPWDSETDRHPLLHRDAKLVESLKCRGYHRKSIRFAAGDFYFGFESLEQLYSWFYYQYFEEFCKENEVVMAKYEIPSEHFVAGHTQAVVDKEYFKNKDVEPVAVFEGGDFPKN